MIVILLVVIVAFYIQQFSAQEGTACSISESEYEALEAIYDSLDGQHWKWDITKADSTRWSFPSTVYTPCLDSWQGLIFDYTDTGDCAVVSVILVNMDLSGTLPEAIGNLSNTINLNIASNSVYGSLPASIGNMKALSSLELDINSINGVLPNSLYTLTNLETLSMSETLVSGTNQS
jgi:Leucine-rich repeat (LRR) protein